MPIARTSNTSSAMMVIGFSIPWADNENLPSPSEKPLDVRTRAGIGPGLLCGAALFVLPRLFGVGRTGSCASKFLYIRRREFRVLD